MSTLLVSVQRQRLKRVRKVALAAFGVEAKLDLTDSLKPGKEDENPGEEKAWQGVDGMRLT